MFQYLLPMIKIMGNIRTLNKTKIKDFFFTFKPNWHPNQKKIIHKKIYIFYLLT